MQEIPRSDKERSPLQSVIFQLDECIDAFSVLEEINKIHKNMLASKTDAGLPMDRSLVVPLLGIVRDSFCTRLASLFDKRKDVHSLKKYFKGEAIDRLQNHPVTKASIDARHGNIAHLGKKYVQWPSVENILSSNIEEILKGIKLGVIFPSSGARDASSE